MRFYDGETDLSGDGIFHHDIYDHSEQPDRRNRKAASSAERIHVPVHEIAMMMSIALRLFQSFGRDG